MNSPCIKAIVRKDAIAAMRNKLLLLALMSGILFSVVYYALPSTVEETFTIAIYDKSSSQLFSHISELEGEGVRIDFFSSEKDIEKAVRDEDYVAGIVLPQDFISLLMSGQKPVITLYFKSETPESIRTSINYFIQSTIEYIVVGTQPTYMEIEILGEDIAGKHIPLREQSLPLYLLMALMMEMWTISTLIVEESAAGTLKAVLVTPASPSDVITAKGFVGIGYSLIVAAAILVLTQSIRGNLPVLFLGIILGAIMAVSMGLFFGSLTKNITGSYIYVGVPFLVLMIPALLIFIPGISLSAVKVIPTYYLVNAFDQILNYGAGLADVGRDFLIVACCDIVFFISGVYALRRQYS
ncbi:MAG: ABC transporter permease [Candidatus Methanofastidiosia archaeon]